MKVKDRIQFFPVLGVAVFLAVGIIVGEHLHGIVSLKAWLAALVCSVVFMFLTFRYAMIQTILIFITMVMFGGILTEMKLRDTEVSFPDHDIEYKAVVVSTPVKVGKVVRCDLLIADREHPIKVKASFYRDERAERLKMGNGVAVRSVLEQPENFSGATFDYRRYLLYHGYVATTFIYITDWEGANVSLVNLSKVQRIKIVAMKFRDELTSRYRDMGLTGQDYAVMSAMTLGDKSALPKELKDDYSVSGAAHVLALSGLHLGIIYAVLSLFLMGLRRRVSGTALIVCAIWTYVFIVGMSASVVRAAVMLTIYSFIGLLNRDRMSLNALSVAAVVILVNNPLDLYDVGFQMSFIAVLSIFALYRPVFRLLPYRLRSLFGVRQAWQMASVSIAAQVGVAPLVALYFGRFSCYFLLTNLLVVPLATVILYGVVVMALLFFLPPLQTFIAAFLFKIVSWLNSGVSFIASLPGASIEGLHISWLHVLLYYIIIADICVISFYVRKMFWMHRNPFKGEEHYEF